MELADAKENIKIKLPFNICALGEVSEISPMRKELNNYFEKIEITKVISNS